MANCYLNYQRVPQVPIAFPHLLSKLCHTTGPVSTVKSYQLVGKTMFNKQSPSQKTIFIAGRNKPFPVSQSWLVYCFSRMKPVG